MVCNGVFQKLKEFGLRPKICKSLFPILYREPSPHPSKLSCTFPTTISLDHDNFMNFQESGPNSAYTNKTYPRLCVLNGPAMAFLPPLLAYKALRASECTFTELDTVSPDIWQGRLQEISGSLLVACVSFLIIGGTGMAGLLARLIGPITIVPLMILLTASVVPTVESKLSLHWISLV
ncbi:unnamed protein product [Cylicostephanus goldi]|uniref:Uncharacterized protein n=1 Tax=Cylicostephanus goldi TaxID=71465 RepID=A0A3P6S2K9_CYLGO|nr:unnamed protein product [Cylicostephanus goldi]